MLSSISWPHYLAAVIIITVSYYGYILLRYYQTEIANLFKREKISPGMFAGLGSSFFQVMGDAKPDTGVTLNVTEELQFADTLPDEVETSPHAPSPADNENLPESEPAHELILEAGGLIEAFKDIDDKEEFLTLLRILIDSYKGHRNEIDLPAMLGRVVDLTKEKLKFTVLFSDLQFIWA